MGSTDGDELGLELGSFDGLLDGDELGLDDGTCDATFVGIRLGDGLGISLRTTDGL